MVCIVCPPGPNRTVLLHLVNMSPSGGASPANANCLTSPGVSVLPCPHQHITDSIVASIVRLENNGKQYLFYLSRDVLKIGELKN